MTLRAALAYLFCFIAFNVLFGEAVQFVIVHLISSP